jgi:hypothetical protein
VLEQEIERDKSRSSTLLKETSVVEIGKVGSVEGADYVKESVKVSGMQKTRSIMRQ